MNPQLVIAKIGGQVGVVGDHQRDAQFRAVINAADAQQDRLKGMQHIRLELLQFLRIEVRGNARRNSG